VKNSIHQLRRKIARLHRVSKRLINELTKSAWDFCKDIPCTCGGVDDGLHSKHCRRRIAVEELEREIT
jgi:hypothetical protein